MRTVISSALVLWVAGVIAAAQAPVPDIWQGVYSPAQAERGRTVYLNACIRCHGADLAGTTAPALRGDRFFDTWGGDSVSRLFEKIRDTMPPNFSTTLDDTAKLDIVAFILQTNGFPAGRDLPAGNALASIHILRKGEQPRVQNFALVQAVGCLAREGSQWVLRRASTPAATTEATPTGSALGAAAGMPLGTQAFVLLSSAPFNPPTIDGRKVEVRGLIYQEADDSLLTLTALTPVGNCQ
jgi:mono/diheme cytochrome c family protein